ncbi:MAG: pyridoxal 5'-phosphate synthase [Pseudoalteromonas distincta]
MDSPLDRFQQWWNEALRDTPLQQKNAVCVSTIDEMGFPSGRFVDLKSVNDSGFVFCTYIDSVKGKEILRNPKVAMTVWWDHVGYQVRVVGVAEPIDEAEADSYWTRRSRSAQLTTTAFEQSQLQASEEELDVKVKEASVQFDGAEIPRPSNWGGFIVKPLSVEFLSFRQSRLHLRELYKQEDKMWVKRLLQP